VKRDAKLFSRNPLTTEGAGRLADALAFCFNYDAQDVAGLLLLIDSFAYEPDATDREIMLNEATLRLAAYLPGVDEATEAAMRGRFDALKGGAR
jgi:hypothetical protein